ncbi:MAG: glycosyl transferase family 2 [Candidatus Brocadiaceae bacterium]|nr:glycosyl transferase family 2 [Candidatus Brocadiaceae bacterium]
MKRPSVSVIMSVYNGERFMAAAIESILNQTFTNFEFLITDDGSTDETPAILCAYASKDDRVRVIRQKNAGLTDTLNRMVKIAQGEFVARMDADDLSFPERLKRQIEKMREKPDYLVTGCWFRTLDGNNNPSRETIFPDKPEVLKQNFHKGINCFAHGSVVLRKKIFTEMGFSYRFKYGQDFDLWLRLSEQGSVGMVEKVLYHRYDHSNTISKSLVPRRVALMKLMLTLSEERMRFKREVTNWNEEEQRIFEEVPLWTEKEIQAHDRFLEVRKLLCSGKNKKARRILHRIKTEMPNFNNVVRTYYISHLPGWITAPFLKLRDKINNKRFYIRPM